MKKSAILSVTFLILILILITPNALAQTLPETTLTIEGQLINGTSGKVGQAGIPLMLHTYNGRQMTGMIDGLTGPEGAFRFEEVEVIEGRLFEVMATVGQTTYFSEVAAPSPGQKTLALPVTFYDTTTDASAIHFEQLHTLVDFFSPTLLEITEVYIISNDGNQTVEEAITLEDGQSATLRFTLPEGAVNLSFEQGKLGERFIQTGDGFADTRGVPPGSETSQLIAKYYLPYQDGVGINRAHAYPTDKLSLFLPEMGVSLTSADLTSEGSRQMQDGRTVDIFAAEGIPAGESFSFELSGQPELGLASESPELSPQPASQPIPARTSVVIGWGIIALGSVALIAGGIWWSQQRTMASVPLSNSGQMPEIEAEWSEVALIRTIAELDEAYQEGALSDESYAEQRGDLRDELKALLIQDGPTGSDTITAAEDQEVETVVEPDVERY